MQRSSRKLVGYTIKNNRVVNVYESQTRKRVYRSGKKLKKYKRIYKTKEKARKSPKKSRRVSSRKRIIPKKYAKAWCNGYSKSDCNSEHHKFFTSTRKNSRKGRCKWKKNKCNIAMSPRSKFRMCKDTDILEWRKSDKPLKKNGLA